MVMVGGRKNFKTMNDEHMVGIGCKYDNNYLRIHFFGLKNNNTCWTMAFTKQMGSYYYVFT
jgi:hypothetical protein